MNHSRLFLLSTLTYLISASSATADTPPPSSSQITVAQDGTVHVPSYELPLSIYMSDQAKQAYIKARTSPAVELPHDIVKLRETLDRLHYEPRIARAKEVYPVSITDTRIAGVHVNIVVPAAGVDPSKRDRVLINLHGGGMEVGEIYGGLLESIPFAAVDKIKIVAVDYREAPEHRYPAANEDVVAVYAELLKQYQPEDIGIYGCSAGAGLTAMSLAWFQEKGLPTPGAAGIFCLGADYKVAGDSSFTAAPLIEFLGARVSVPPPDSQTKEQHDDYLGDTSLESPLIAPALYPTVLAKFPPVLLITGSRDIAMSSTIHTHAELVNVGVDAELHVWDGMWHSFFDDVDLPESKEVYKVTADFFDSHLGKRSRSPGH